MCYVTTAVGQCVTVLGCQNWANRFPSSWPCQPGVDQGRLKGKVLRALAKVTEARLLPLELVC